MTTVHLQRPSLLSAVEDRRTGTSGRGPEVGRPGEGERWAVIEPGNAVMLEIHTPPARVGPAESQWERNGLMGLIEAIERFEAAWSDPSDEASGEQQAATRELWLALNDIAERPYNRDEPSVVERKYLVGFEEAVSYGGTLYLRTSARNEDDEIVNVVLCIGRARDATDIESYIDFGR